MELAAIVCKDDSPANQISASMEAVDAHYAQTGTLSAQQVGISPVELLELLTSRCVGLIDRDRNEFCRIKTVERTKEGTCRLFIP